MSANARIRVINDQRHRVALRWAMYVNDKSITVDDAAHRVRRALLPSCVTFGVRPPSVEICKRLVEQGLETVKVNPLVRCD